MRITKSQAVHLTELSMQAEDFMVAIEFATTELIPGIRHVVVPGGYLFNPERQLFWFEHHVFFETCNNQCYGHQFWGAVVGDMREFDSMTDQETPYQVWGFRVLDNPMEAINGTWVDGGLSYEQRKSS